MVLLTKIEKNLDTLVQQSWNRTDIEILNTKLKENADKLITVATSVESKINTNITENTDKLITAASGVENKIASEAISNRENVVKEVSKLSTVIKNTSIQFAKTMKENNAGFKNLINNILDKFATVQNESFNQILSSLKVLNEKNDKIKSDTYDVNAQITTARGEVSEQANKFERALVALLEDKDEIKKILKSFGKQINAVSRRVKVIVAESDAVTNTDTPKKPSIWDKIFRHHQ